MRLTYNWIVKEKDIKQILLYYKEGKKNKYKLKHLPNEFSIKYNKVTRVENTLKVN